MQQLTRTEFRTKLSECLDRALQGEGFAVTRNGRHVCLVLPLSVEDADVIVDVLADASEDAERDPAMIDRALWAMQKATQRARA